MESNTTKYTVRVVRTFVHVEDVEVEASSAEEAAWLASHHIDSVDRRAGIPVDELRQAGACEFSIVSE